MLIEEEDGGDLSQKPQVIKLEKNNQEEGNLKIKETDEDIQISKKRPKKNMKEKKQEAKEIEKKIELEKRNSVIENPVENDWTVVESNKKFKSHDEKVRLGERENTTIIDVEKSIFEDGIEPDEPNEQNKIQPVENEVKSKQRYKEKNKKKQKKKNEGMNDSEKENAELNRNEIKEKNINNIIEYLKNELEKRKMNKKKK
jgi:hypothetical protein